jgi:glycine C-acetyltransferase
MDGIIANLAGVCDLADKYDALVVVDDSHATGFVGKTGRGSQEHCGVMGRVDIITGTFGKALGGASGGFTSGRKEIIQLLRQRSRPYLFSNTLAPAMCAATLKSLEIVSSSTALRDKVEANANYFRSEMSKRGFDLAGEGHPIIPVMLYDAVLSQKVAAIMQEKGIYVTGFYYPVVPKGKARIRTQMSAAHTFEDIDACVAAFEYARKTLGF